MHFYGIKCFHVMAFTTYYSDSDLSITIKLIANSTQQTDLFEKKLMPF